MELLVLLSEKDMQTSRFRLPSLLKKSKQKSQLNSNSWGANKRRNKMVTRRRTVSDPDEQGLLPNIFLGFLYEDVWRTFVKAFVKRTKFCEEFRTVTPAVQINRKTCVTWTIFLFEPSLVESIFF